MQKLIFLLLSVLIISCKSDLEQTWIGVYSYQTNDSIYNDNSPRVIYHFGKDTFIRKPFFYQFIGEDVEIQKYAYQRNGNEIIIVDSIKNDTLYIDFQKDRMTINYDSWYETTYQPLPKYNQANQLERLKQMLLTNTFEIIEKDIKVEFQEDIRFVKYPLDSFFGSNQLWVLDTFEDELFLVVDEDSGFLLHITQVEDDKFSGIQYGRKNQRFNFKKLPKSIVFKKEDLVGKWERYYDANHQFNIPPQLPKSHPDYRKYYEKELLIIDDSTLVRYNEFKIDTVDWTMNREQEMMLFSKWKYNSTLDRRQWDIQALDENKLIIKRYNRDFDFRKETITFVRQK